MAKAAFTQATVTRAVKAVLAAGVAVGRVEVAPDGRVVIFSADDPKAAPAKNDWD